MNHRMILSLLGIVLVLIAGFLLLPCIVALIYHESELLFFVKTIAISGALGGLLTLLRPKKRTMQARDGFVMVSLAWILISLVGALPFWFSGAIPSYLDAVFETVSGFTTTGASIVPNVEVMAHCLLFWRSFTHWLGGMGVLVFMLAIVPMSGDSIYLLRAESPGPSVGKMVPKMRSSSMILYAIYLGITVLQICFYQLANVIGAGEISFFDSVCLAFGTAGTGGFSTHADGLASFSVYIQGVTTVFMILFGVNFSVYFFLLCRKFKLVWQNSELKAYLSIILIAITVIVLNLTLTGGYFDSLGQTVHHVSFSVGSIITTTGYGTADFAAWPELSRTIICILMIIGASAGSTGGGMKVSRFLILAKSARAEVRHMLHPNNVEVMTMDGKKVSKDVIRGTAAYLTVYVFIACISILLVSLEGCGTETTVSGVLATLNNIGPGTSAMIGPFGSFAGFTPLTKIVMIFDMLFGRLELFPMVLMLRPSTWRKN